MSMRKPKIVGFDNELGLLLADYEMEVSFTMKDLVSMFEKFSEDDIKYFIANGVIRKFPLTLLDLVILEKIHKIWKTKSLIKINLKKFSKKDRHKILFHCNSGAYTQLEVWIFSRIYNLLKTDINIKLPRKEIRNEAIKFFNLKNNRKTHREIEKIIDRTSKRIKKELKKKQ